MPKLEIIASTLDDARTAAESGADSLELCVDIERDGLTMPLETVRAIREAVDCELQVMLRPHDRDFVYTPAEQALMLAQARDFAALGITSLVVGGLTPAGDFDMALLTRLNDALPDVGITVHRALDHARDAETALARMVEEKRLQRVLTSGNVGKAEAGQARLRDWVARYSPPVEVVVAGGVTQLNIMELARATGAAVMHVGSAARCDGIVDGLKTLQLKRLLKLV